MGLQLCEHDVVINARVNIFYHDVKKSGAVAAGVLI